MNWHDLYQWVGGLGEAYGVDPILFAVIYIGAIPAFLISLAWVIRRRRKQRSIVVPAACTSFSFFSSYFYLFFVGENLPEWVYVFVATMIGYGVVAAILHIHWQCRNRSSGEDAPDTRILQ